MADYEFPSERRVHRVTRRFGEEMPEVIANTADEVRRQLAAGKAPMLPYEWVQMAATLREREKDQAELGRKLGEAMNQSSETDHDNGPGDAVVNDSIPLVGRAKTVIKKMGNAVLLDYPVPTDGQLTLGSIAEVTFNGDDETEWLMLIGNRGTLPNFGPEHGKTLGDLAFMTVGGAVGKSVLGLVMGGATTYRLENGRQQSIQIHDIRQLSPDLLAQAEEVA